MGSVQGDRCCESRKRGGAGTVEGLSKSPGAPTMLALLALPLLAVSARGQVEERNLLEDIIEDLERQHQYPDYQYSDQMYDAEPAPPARALHQDDLRAATRQGKQIKSSMLPAYCDPPNPCPLGYTAQDGCIEDFENNSEFSQKYQASHSLREPSCPLRRRREWATRSSGFATWGHHHHDQQRMERFVSSPRYFLSQQEERGWGNKNTSTSCSESRFNPNSSQPHFVIWKYITFYFRV